MSFCFGFLDGDANNDAQPSDGAKPENNDTDASRKPFAWIDKSYMKDLWKERVDQEIVCDVVDEDCMLRRVDLQRSSFVFLKGGNEEGVDSTPHKASDVIQTDVYEGGAAVWECSLDLVRYLREQNIVVDGKVLELGCGHALPACYVLRQYYLRRQQNQEEGNLSLTLTDYNQSVLFDATLSNLVINMSGLWSQEDSVENFAERVNWGHGDWMGLLHSNNQTERMLYDFILAAETIYTEQAAQETASLLSRLLVPRTGKAYIATKRYYFGVGGGVHAFQNSPACVDLEVKVVCVHDNGHGNIREILEVARKA